MIDDVEKPLVSVIVPVYNVENYLRNCLESLINQSYHNWEAILVDDGSKDSSGAICDDYAQKDSRFKVLHKNNGGLSSARNVALSRIKGEYVFFLDSDDFIRRDALEILIDIAEDSGFDIVQCDFIRGCEKEFPQKIEDYKIQIFNNRTIFTSYAAKIITCGKLYSNNVIKNIIFPEGLINEDDFTTWKYYYNANKIAVISRPLYYYTINPNSIVSQQKRKPNLKYFDAYRERIDFFKEKKEPELEAVSRIQWLKSLVLITSNKNLDKSQRKEIDKAFRENYSALNKSGYKYPLQLRFIFKAYALSPRITGIITRRIYKSKS